jgi:hypothetical protein
MARRSLGGRRRGVVALVERVGITRGLFGGSKGWFYVGTGLWTLRRVRTLGARKPEILLREELKPGQRLVIANDRLTLTEPEAAATLVASAIDGGKADRKGRRRGRRRDRA